MTYSKALKRQILVILFKNLGVPYTSWGKGSAKTIEHLIKEIDNDESVLKRENDTLCRYVSVLYVDVVCTVEGIPYILTEDRQEFRDGRVRNRTLPASLAEKLQSEEEPNDAAVARALEEEIGVPKIGLLSVQFGESWNVRDYSPSYPGLLSHFQNHKAVVEIHPLFFKPEGYVEYQEDKVTYFVWKKDTS